MNTGKLEVVDVDFYSGREFVLYFSDDTFISLSSETLATHFPNRTSVPEGERGEGPKDLIPVVAGPGDSKKTG